MIFYILIVFLVALSIYELSQYASGKTCLECGRRNIWGTCKYCKKWSE